MGVGWRHFVRKWVLPECISSQNFRVPGGRRREKTQKNRFFEIFLKIFEKFFFPFRVIFGPKKNFEKKKFSKKFLKKKNFFFFWKNFSKKIFEKKIFPFLKKKFFPFWKKNFMMSHESWWVMSQDESLVMTHPNSSQWRRRNQPSEARNRKNNMTFLFFVYLFVVHLCTCLFVCCALVYLFRLWWNFNGEDETNRAKRGIGKKGKRKKEKEEKGKKKKGKKEKNIEWVIKQDPIKIEKTERSEVS